MYRLKLWLVDLMQRLRLSVIGSSVVISVLTAVAIVALVVYLIWKHG